jgi:hypothetical protein
VDALVSEVALDSPVDHHAVDPAAIAQQLNVSVDLASSGVRLHDLKYQPSGVPDPHTSRPQRRSRNLSLRPPSGAGSVLSQQTKPHRS